MWYDQKVHVQLDGSANVGLMWYDQKVHVQLGSSANVGVSVTHVYM